MAHSDNQAQTRSDEQASPIGDDPRPPTPRRSRDLGDRLLDRFFGTGHILETERIAARMIRVRISAPALRNSRCLPGQHVRVAIGDAEGGLLARVGDLRTYTVWQFDSARGEFDLCVMDHGDGPGSRWGRAAEPGAQVLFRGPEGSFILHDSAPYHLFAGEETASVAFGAMLAAVPDHIPVYGAVETATPQDRLPLPRTAALAAPLRGEASAARSQVLLEAVRELELPATPGVAYLAGEARTIQMISKHLVHERNWPRRAIRTKPFWTPGKRGMD
ncbi:siderophore-interacting protein [Nocardia sp. NPDC058058]|uniref:siderophore-interacting protein n=1 Tax=Nocardia sp. NPDC058058 TaxID=3346317 RepID=UPI0036DE26F9